MIQTKLLLATVCMSLIAMVAFSSCKEDPKSKALVGTWKAEQPTTRAAQKNYADVLKFLPNCTVDIQFAMALSVDGNLVVMVNDAEVYTFNSKENLLTIKKHFTYEDFAKTQIEVNCDYVYDVHLEGDDVMTLTFKGASNCVTNVNVGDKIKFNLDQKAKIDASMSFKPITYKRQ